MFQTSLDFKTLIAPIHFDSFIADYLGKATLRLSREQPMFYDGLFGSQQIDEAVYAAVRTRGAVQILQYGVEMKGCTDYPTAAAATRAGKSLRVNGVQRYSRGVGQFARSVEQSLGVPVNINAYMTPGEAQALGEHYDTHDVFVLQVLGSKRWSIFDLPESTPLEYVPPLRGAHRDTAKTVRRSKNQTTQGQAKETAKFTLEAGDLLYVPRGFRHEARTESSKMSCHLTVGLQIYTYLDLLTLAVSNYALDECEILRMALPLGLQNCKLNGGTIADELTSVIKSLTCKLDYDRALRELKAHFLQNKRAVLRPIVPVDAARLTASMTSSSTLRRVDGAVWGWESSPSSARLLCTSRQLDFPPEYSEMVQFVVHNLSFSVQDVPHSTCTSAKQEFLDKLLKEELLVIAS